MYGLQSFPGGLASLPGSPRKEVVAAASAPKNRKLAFNDISLPTIIQPGYTYGWSSPALIVNDDIYIDYVAAASGTWYEWMLKAKIDRSTLTLSNVTNTARGGGSSVTAWPQTGAPYMRWQQQVLPDGRVYRTHGCWANPGYIHNLTTFTYTQPGIPAGTYDNSGTNFSSVTGGQNRRQLIIGDDQLLWAGWDSNGYPGLYLTKITSATVIKATRGPIVLNTSGSGTNKTCSLVATEYGYIATFTWDWTTYTPQIGIMAFDKNLNYLGGFWPPNGTSQYTMSYRGSWAPYLVCTKYQDNCLILIFRHGTSSPAGYSILPFNVDSSGVPQAWATSFQTSDYEKVAYDVSGNTATANFRYSNNMYNLPRDDGTPAIPLEDATDYIANLEISRDTYSQYLRTMLITPYIAASHINGAGTFSTRVHSGVIHNIAPTVAIDGYINDYGDIATCTSSTGTGWLRLMKRIDA